MEPFFPRLAEPDGAEALRAAGGALSYRALAGAAVPLSPKAGPRELAHVVADSVPEVVLAAPGAALPAELAAVRRLDVELTGDAPLADALGAEDTAIVLYTSGTTGPSAGELRAHAGTLLAAHTCPREGRLVALLPRNAMGKVLRAKRELP